MDPRYYSDFADSLYGVVFFIANFIFYNQSGYFDLASQVKPLQHTWSLAIEEQFYLIYPCLILILFSIQKNKKFFTLLIIFLVLFVLSVVESSKNYSSAFYLIQFRAWELLAGGLIAFYFLENDKILNNLWINNILSLFGMLAICISVVNFDQYSNNNGLITLMPIIGTCLVIIFCRYNTILYNLLSRKFLVYTGLASYSAYLLHKPIFSFVWIETDGDLEIYHTSIILISLIPLSFLSYKFVEKPFRNINTISFRTLIIFLSIISILISSIAYFSTNYQRNFYKPYIPNYIIDTMSQPKKAYCEYYNIENIHLSNDWFCQVGSNSTKIDFLLFGDSHSNAILPAIDAASKIKNKSGITIGAGGILPFLETYSLRADQKLKDYNKLNERVFLFVKQNNIKKIILVSAWNNYLEGGYNGREIDYAGLSSEDDKTLNNNRIAFFNGLKKTVERYSKIGTEVIILRQVPMHKGAVLNGYEDVFLKKEFSTLSLLDNLKKQSITVKEHNNLNNKFDIAVSKLINERNLKIINLDNIFCKKQNCMIGDEMGAYYWDGSHLSKYGAEKTVSEIIKIF